MIKGNEGVKDNGSQLPEKDRTSTTRFWFRSPKRRRAFGSLNKKKGNRNVRKSTDTITSRHS